MPFFPCDRSPDSCSNENQNRQPISLKNGIMPYTKLSHEGARARVCKVCVLKKKCVRRITERTEALIAKHYRSGLDAQDDSLPTGICGQCRQALNAMESGKPGKHCLPPPDHFDYR